jgi:hypothetical protein
MKVLACLYDSDRKGPAVDPILDRLEDRDEAVEYVDVGTDGSEREAMLLVGETTRIGSKPDDIFDEAGTPDFSPGVLITEQETGRRELHVGADMLDALSSNPGQ